MRFAVINSTDGTFHVHRAGCRDIPRDERRANGPHWITEADDATACVREEIADLCADFDDPTAFSAADFAVYPCAL